MTGSLVPSSQQFELLRVCTEALDGDGSTATMPDVRPFDAARWMLAALDKAGYDIVKRADP